MIFCRLSVVGQQGRTRWRSIMPIITALIWLSINRIGSNTVVMRVSLKTIVDNADMVIAFWDGTSKGTQNAINYAKKQAKPVVIINV